MSSTSPRSGSREAAAEHLDDADARSAVQDREGVDAPQSVPAHGLGHEAFVLGQVGHPQRLTVLEDPLRDAIAAVHGIAGPLGGEPRRNVRARRPHVVADRRSGGREPPEGGDVPLQSPPEYREELLGRGFAHRCRGHQLEEFSGQLTPAVKLKVAGRAGDDDADRAGPRMVDHTHDELTHHPTAVPAEQGGRNRLVRPLGAPRSDEGGEGLVQLVSEMRCPDVGGRLALEPTTGPTEEPLGRRVGVEDRPGRVADDDRVGQPVDDVADGRHGHPAGLGILDRSRHVGRGPVWVGRCRCRTVSACAQLDKRVGVGDSCRGGRRRGWTGLNGEGILARISGAARWYPRPPAVSPGPVGRC